MHSNYRQRARKTKDLSSTEDEKNPSYQKLRRSAVSQESRTAPDQETPSESVGIYGCRRFR